jgi:hypothetical protein
MTRTRAPAMQIADPLSPFFAFPFLAHLTVDGRPGVIALGGGGGGGGEFKKVSDPKI